MDSGKEIAIKGSRGSAGSPRLGGGLLARNRARLERELRDSDRRQLFSPALLCLSRALKPRLHSSAQGRLLDAGCGTMPYRGDLPRVTEYTSVDVETRDPRVDLVADLEDLSALDGESFDSVLCSEVLEHVRHPQRVIGELHRVLKPGGVIILSTPFLCRLHEEPHDYFRYTSHGLRILLEEAGFQIEEMLPTGSLFSFLGHQVSSIVVCSVWHVPILKDVVFWLNAVSVTLPCWALDRLLAPKERLPLGYVIIARRYNGLRALSDVGTS